jgi:hypothetical protein
VPVSELLIQRLHSITSYGERENRYEDVAEYFRAHFAQVHKRKGVQKQELYIVCFNLHIHFLIVTVLLAFHVYAREFLSRT